MRHHPQAALPPLVLDDLNDRQTKLNRSLADKRTTDKTRKARTDRAWARWKSKSRKCVEAQLKCSASAGQPRERCVYCESDGGSTIDHVEPRAKTPAKTFVWENLVWACSPCNQSKLDKPASIVNPTTTDPLGHMMLSSTGAWVGLDPLGDNTVKTVRALDEQAMNRARLDALVTHELMLLKYCQAIARGDEREADIWKRAVLEGPFTDVFAATIRRYRDPVLQVFVSRATMKAIASRPEILDWLDVHDRARRTTGDAEVARLASKIRVPKSNRRR
jgi:5-methylcytosine-specific restriction endonuclease McrA